MRLSPGMRRALTLVVLAVGIAIASSDRIGAQQGTLYTNGYIDCGGMNEAPCGVLSEFDLSNAGQCDRGLKLDFIANKCINHTRRQLLNANVEDVYVGKNFAEHWIGRALRMQRKDLNYDTSFGRLSQIHAHNGYNTEADGMVAPNQKYSLTEMLDAGIRAFEWDVHHHDPSTHQTFVFDTGEVPQFCHGESGHEGCFLDNRDFFNAARELRDWLKEPGHQDDVVMINLEYRVDNASQNFSEGDRLVKNAIERYLDIPGIGVLTESELLAYMNSHPAAETFGEGREWPSQRWLVENNNRVIFIGPAHRGPYVNLSYYYYDNNDVPPYFEVGGRAGASYPSTQIDNWIANGSGYPSCSVAMEHDGQPGFVKYLRPESGVFYGYQSDDWIGGATTITPDLVAQLTACNVDNISMDQILVDHGRLQAAVWSWEINQPPVNAAGKVARMARATGRWWATSGLEPRPFLCRKETRQTVAGVSNLPVVEFAVSGTTGNFADGHEACADIDTGWTFSPPLNGYENLDAKKVVENLATDPYLNFLSEGQDKWKKHEVPMFTVDGPDTVTEGDTATISFVVDLSATLTNRSCGAGAELVAQTLVLGTRVQWGTFTCRYHGGPNRSAIASVTAAYPSIGSLTQSTPVSVTNRPPAITGLASEMTVSPNAFANLVFTIDDATGEPIPFITIDWGVLGGTQTVNNLSAGLVSVPHHFVWEGANADHQVRINVWDEAMATASTTITVRISNTAPTGIMEGPTRVSVGPANRKNFNITTSDPDGGFPALESTSCGEYGRVIGTSFVQDIGNARQYLVRCEFTSPAPYNRITMTVKDDEQQSVTYDWWVQIGGPPTGSITGPTSVTEGSYAPFFVSADPTQGDDVTLVEGSVTCGPASLALVVPDNAAGLGLHTGFGCNFGDNTATPVTLRAQVLDVDGVSSFSLDVTVTNAAPQILNLLAPATVSHGNPGTLSGETKDPGGDAVRVRVLWGEAGETGQEFPVVNNLFTAPHSWSLPGTYEVVIVPIDDENAEGAPVRRTITVADDVDPTLLLPALAPIPAIGPVTPVTYDASASDNVAVRSFDCTPASGSSFAVGTHTVTCTAVDTSDNDVTGTFTIIVRDDAGPSLNPPDLGPIEATGPATAVSFSVIATDNADQSPTVTCTPASPVSLAPGTHPVTCSATDDSGNVVHDSFEIEVRDRTAPSLTLFDVGPIEATAAATPVTYSGTATDLVDGSVPLDCAPAPGAGFAVGTHTVSCTAADRNGNIAPARSFTVTIADTTAPELTVANVIETGSNPAVNGAVATFAPVATDAVGVTSLDCTHPSGAIFAFGTTHVSCAASDGRLATTKSFTVTVLDGVAPVVTVPADLTREAAGANGAAVTFTATATDNVSGALSPSCSPQSGSMFPVGATTVTCSATDGRNTGSASFSVTIADVTTPGEMRGDGFVRDDGAKYMFQFLARERASGAERARLSIRIDEDGKKKAKKNQKRDDRFESRSVDFMAFSDDPTIRPGRQQRPQVDTVVFRGVGEWNGVGGYRYEVFAQDQGEPGRHRESIRVTIMTAAGQVVASFEGELDGGNAQSRRLHR
jgi:hypothetical protein